MARKFRFRLETLRRVRELEQDAQRRCLAVAIREVSAMEGQLTKLGEQLRDTFESCRTERDFGRLDAATLRAHQQHTEYLHRGIRDAQIQLVARQEQVGEEQAKLAQARKKLRVLEKLREKKRESYLREVVREEQKETDEAASQMMLCRSSIAG